MPLLKNAHGRLLLIRADGGSQIGFSHLMRSTALAEEWLARGGRCVWATTEPRALDAAGTGRDDVKIITLDGAAGTMGDARATRRIAEECDADWVAADLPVFQPAYFSSAGARGSGWMIVYDDPLNVNERINVILNPGPHAVPEFYPGRSPKCALLLGLEYALIRSEIRSVAAHAQKALRPVRKILITFGGSDPGDLSFRTLEAFSRMELPAAVHCRVIMGPGYRGECASRAADFRNLSVELVRYASNMGNHYAWADLIVCGASTTLWEAFHFNLPAVVLLAAKNQQAVLSALAHCPSVKWFASPDAEFARWISAVAAGDGAGGEWLQKAAAAPARLVDGLGASRVVDYLLAGKPQ